MEGFGSAGRTRTYNPSVNSRTACSRLTLQTQDLDAPESNFPGNWGGLWGYSHRPYNMPSWRAHQHLTFPATA